MVQGLVHFLLNILTPDFRSFGLLLYNPRSIAPTAAKSFWLAVHEQYRSSFQKIGVYGGNAIVRSKPLRSKLILAPKFTLDPQLLVLIHTNPFSCEKMNNLEFPENEKACKHLIYRLLVKFKTIFAEWTGLE
ncbi:hypothetical protein J7E50_00195, partial [Pedobacter sp. ISL-68]|nr:hypothetical protein [Pedobacter sp. ISL-68]